MIVHEMTKMFRQVLDGMSRPGEVKTVDGVNHHTSLYDTTYLLAQTLLDNEVTCTLYSEDANDQDEFKMILNVNLVASDDADYIVVGRSVDMQRVLGDLKQSKVGTFIDPQLNATWIIEVDGFNGTTSYELTGPGIETMNEIHIDGMNDVFEVRNTLCEEFPLGIDMILVSQDSLIGIPRTSVIKEVQ